MSAEPGGAEDSGVTRHASRGVAQAFVGLAVLGFGVSILLQVAPHEDWLVGIALAVFGTALIATASTWPEIRSMPRWLVVGAGATLILVVVGFNLFFASSFSSQEAALVVFGSVLVCVGPFSDREISLPLRRHPRVHVATLVACSLAVVGAPLAIWGLQAMFLSVAGQTPIEVFVAVALLPPLALFLGLVGWSPIQDGQAITYETRSGLMTVNVGAACSGVQAMGLFTAVLALVLLVVRPGGRAILLWSVIGVAGVYVANVIRLIFLAVVGHLWGVDALLRAHAEAGWIFFVGWAIMFALLVRRTTPVPAAG